MGMYSEVIIGARLGKDTPKVCVEAMKACADGTGVEASRAGVRKFIAEFDLYNLFHDWSSYFPAHSAPRIEDDDDGYLIMVHSSVRNHSDKVDSFLRYIRPYVMSGSGLYNIFAYVLYESNRLPVIYSTRGVWNLESDDLVNILKEKRDNG